MSSKEDCYFFIQGSCRNGDNCPFRHSEKAKATTEVCQSFAQTGSCTEMDCGKRHSKTVSKEPTKKQPSEIQCRNEENGATCTRPDCYFMHRNPRPALNPSVAASGGGKVTWPQQKLSASTKAFTPQSLGTRAGFTARPSYQPKPSRSMQWTAPGIGNQTTTGTDQKLSTGTFGVPRPNNAQPNSMASALKPAFGNTDKVWARGQPQQKKPALDSKPTQPPQRSPFQPRNPPTQQTTQPSAFGSAFQQSSPFKPNKASAFAQSAFQTPTPQTNDMEMDDAQPHTPNESTATFAPKREQTAFGISPMPPPNPLLTQKFVSNKGAQVAPRIFGQSPRAPGKPKLKANMKRNMRSIQANSTPSKGEHSVPHIPTLMEILGKPYMKPQWALPPRRREPKSDMLESARSAEQATSLSFASSNTDFLVSQNEDVEGSSLRVAEVVSEPEPKVDMRSSTIEPLMELPTPTQQCDMDNIHTTECTDIESNNETHKAETLDTDIPDPNTKSTIALPDMELSELEDEAHDSTTSDSTTRNAATSDADTCNAATSNATANNTTTGDHAHTVPLPSSDTFSNHHPIQLSPTTSDTESSNRLRSNSVKSTLYNKPLPQENKNTNKRPTKKHPHDASPKPADELASVPKIRSFKEIMEMKRRKREAESSAVSSEDGLSMTQTAPAQPEMVSGSVGGAKRKFDDGECGEEGLVKKHIGIGLGVSDGDVGSSREQVLGDVESSPLLAVKSKVPNYVEMLEMEMGELEDSWTDLSGPLESAAAGDKISMAKLENYYVDSDIEQILNS